MKINSFRKNLSVVLCVAVVLAITLFTIGCTDNNINETTSAETTASSASENPGVIGQGGKMFFLTVQDKEGSEAEWEIHTDEETVGEALLSEGIIEGEDGPYGLYVKTVNGITLDYDKDGLYWAFYENGEYSLTGVDQTEITEGQTYEFRPQK